MMWGALSLLLATSSAGVTDAFVVQDKVHLVEVHKGRFVKDVGGKRRRAPKNATFVVPCAGKRPYVFVGPDGVLDADGTVVAKRTSLISAADPARLFMAPLCAPSGEVVRLVTPRGIERIRLDDGKVLQVLPFRPRARTYSGTVHQARARERAYAVALSVYVPRMYDVDANADGRVDLVVLSDAELSIYLRQADGSFSSSRIRFDLKRQLKVPVGRPLHVAFGDIDNNGRPDLALSHSAGVVPNETHIAVVEVRGKTLHTRLRTTREGWWFPMLAQNGAWFRAIDTSMLSLGQALMTQEADMTLWRSDGGDLKEQLVVRAHFDLRAPKQNSQLPLLADLDDDGWPELSTLNKDHLLEIRRGRPQGFSDVVLSKSTPKAAVWVPAPSELLVVELASGKVHRMKLPRQRRSR